MKQEDKDEDTLFARIRNMVKRFFGRGVCPYEFSFTLMNPFRRFILSPTELVKRLELKENYRVLELGPGPGYFSSEVANNLTMGQLILVDIQKEMLEKNRKRLHERGISNAALIHADGSTLPLGTNTCDVAFLVAVLGEIIEPSACIGEMNRVIRDGGLLSVTEQPGDPDHMGTDIICNLAENGGFTFSESYGEEKNFTVNFRLDSK